MFFSDRENGIYEPSKPELSGERPSYTSATTRQTVTTKSVMTKCN